MSCVAMQESAIQNTKFPTVTVSAICQNIAFYFKKPYKMSYYETEGDREMDIMKIYLLCKEPHHQASSSPPFHSFERKCIYSMAKML